MKTEKNQPERQPENGKNEFQYMFLSGTEETASRQGEKTESEPVLSWELLTDDGQKAEGPAEPSAEPAAFAAPSRAEDPAPEKEPDEPSAKLTAEPTAELTEQPSEEPFGGEPEGLSDVPTAEEIAAILRSEDTAFAPSESGNGQADVPTAEPIEQPPEEPFGGKPEGLSEIPTAEEIAAILRSEDAAFASPESGNVQADVPTAEPTEEPTAQPTDGKTVEPSEEPTDGSADETAEAVEPPSAEEKRFRRVRGLFDYVETFCLA